MKVCPICNKNEATIWHHLIYFPVEVGLRVCPKCHRTLHKKEEIVGMVVTRKQAKIFCNIMTLLPHIIKEIERGDGWSIRNLQKYVRIFKIRREYNMFLREWKKLERIKERIESGKLTSDLK